MKYDKESVIKRVLTQKSKEDLVSILYYLMIAKEE